MEKVVAQALAATLRGLDETILEYISGAVADQLADEVPSDAATLEELLVESVAPFLLSTSFCEDEEAASKLCASLASKLLASPELQAAGPQKDAVRVLENTQSIEEQARKDEGAADAEQLMARMWGFDKIRKTTNDELEAQQSALSARQVRKQIKLEQLTAEREEEQAELDREWEDARFLPDLTQDNGERDIHVPRLTINFKGKTLLSDTALKIVAGRRYGLVGKNGAGKTTLLRYISHYELEGFRDIFASNWWSRSRLRSSTTPVDSVPLSGWADAWHLSSLNDIKRLWKTAGQLAIHQDTSLLRKSTSTVLSVYDPTSTQINLVRTYPGSFFAAGLTLISRGYWRSSDSKTACDIQLTMIGTNMSLQSSSRVPYASHVAQMNGTMDTCGPVSLGN
ncbi:hypothetical protein AM588_10006725 [Phytophthora nicotianae]|uniref:ABC transporter domain-containing protein n=1 Tax=Phytophthora nicotianae TaxID=4792 RepID=A0A0W8DMI4_PHYNI|nr:hypothetical protein AM588_10006725 [Phytophthora nicotianae]